MTARSLFERYRELILPFLLSCTLSLSVYAIYTSSIPYWLWLIPIAAENIALFAFCGFIKKHNFLGGALMGVLVLLCMRLFFGLIAGSDWGFTFQRWLLTGSEQVDTRAEYLLALLVSFVPFFSVVVYYFTDVLYRMMFLTLLSLVPCTLYVKVLSDIDTVYLCVIALLNVTIFLVHSRTKRQAGVKTTGMRAALLSSAVFIFILLVVSSSIPKEEEARFYDRFEELFMDVDSANELNGDYTNFSEMSGNADNFRGFQERRLFSVNVGYPPYYKRQTFDFYDFEIDRWNNDGSDFSDIAYTPEEWEELHSHLSLTALRQAIIRTDELSEGFVQKYHQSSLVRFAGLKDDVIKSVVTSEKFPAMYFLSPSRIISVHPYASQNYDDYSVTRSGVFRFRERPHPYDFTYSVESYEDVMSRGYWFALRAGDISTEDALAMLHEMDDILTRAGEDELAEAARAHITMTEEAQEYKAMTQDNTALVSDEIRRLAEEITAPYTYDWEKANALASYFILNGYRYDLQYVSEDTSPEYFLFTSKRGSCSDYAAAYVLMARSVGLTVRYCEGYNADPSSRENLWLVKDSGSHAYPEVYLYGLGWTVFEPTVPGDYNEISAADGNVFSNLTFDSDLMATMFTISGIILAVIVVALILIPVIAERRFVNRLENASPDESPVMAYERIKGASDKIVRNRDALTAYELSDKVDRKTGTQFTPVAFLLEKVVYGGGHADEQDKRSVIDSYIKTRDGIKRFIREKTKEERRKYR
ncbi:MAG: hypothetical protein IJ251_04000 [Oscillospiraceae bacterium]|nr:hypothetical protein [Oscillospiraceae bacterium]